MAASRGNFDMALDCHPGDNEPVYSIGIAASLVRVSPRTLRLYESEGVLIAARRSGRRLFSDQDLHWIQCIRALLHREGLNLAGVRCLLAAVNCWEMGCSPSERCDRCPAHLNRFFPCWSLVEREDRPCYDCRVYRQARQDLCMRTGLKLADDLA